MDKIVVNINSNKYKVASVLTQNLKFNSYFPLIPFMLVIAQYFSKRGIYQNFSSDAIQILCVLALSTLSNLSTPPFRERMRSA